MLNKLPYLSENPAYAKYCVGRFSYGNPIIRDWGHANAKLTIGKFCSIGRGTEIFLGGEHNTKWITTFPLNHAFHYDTNRRTRGQYEQEHARGDVVIGNDVWMGVNVLVLSGTTIGDGAIIGANAVVRGNIKPYSINVGNPCVLKKMRYSEEIIAKLLQLKWWDWDDEKIKQHVPLLMSGRIEELCKLG